MLRALRTPDPADERTRRAMLRLFYEQSLVSLVAATLLIVLQAGYASGRTPPWLIGAWVLAFLVLLVMRAVARLALRRVPDGELTAPALTRWERRADAASLATGLLWSVALVMNFEPQRPASQMFCAMLATITVVGSINVMAPLPRAFVALLLPVALTMLGLLASLRSLTGAYFAMLALAGAALALSLLLRHARLLRESHGMRFEREALLAETQAARDAQTRFLAAASHDLRQPVHAIGLLAAQAETELHGRRAAATAAQMQQMAQALDSLVEALLDVSRLDSGAVVAQPRALPLSRLFDRLSSEFAVLAEARGLQWRLRPTALWVVSDELQLERMLRNLLANAVAYTGHGGVLLAAQARGPRVRIAVWDTGPGIAPEHQARVFDEFVQLQNPGRDRRRGHGLGLAIVARIARLLGHGIVLRSRLGRGSLFAIELPRAEPTAEVVETVPLALPLAGRRIALVEDDDAVCAATAALLRAWGCEVWEGPDADTVLRRLRRDGASPERVVSDWRLEVGDGLQAIDALREQAGAELPALLLSGESLPVDAAALAARGITAARKPLPAPALRAWLSAPLPDAAAGASRAG